MLKAVDWEVLCETDPAADAWKELVAGHPLAFNCLGTTKKDGGGARGFKRVDLDYVNSFARACKQNGVTGYAAVSSAGADPTSFFLYLKTKGLADQAAGNLGFDQCIILRPGLLRRGDSSRPIEKLAHFLGSKGFPPATIANAVVQLFESVHHEFIGGTTSMVVANEAKMRAWDAM